MFEKIINILLVFAIVVLLIIILGVFVDLLTFIFCESDIPFWVDYWRTNCGH